jgi:hypothetical protein
MVDYEVSLKQWLYEIDSVCRYLVCSCIAYGSLLINGDTGPAVRTETAESGR